MSPLGFVIPSARRPASATRTALAWLRALRRDGHGDRLTLLHDVRSQQEEDEYRAALGALGPEAAGIRYSGLRDRVDFAKRLRRASGVSPQLIEFALFDPLGVGRSVGAARNQALLQGAGQRTLCVDDDVLPRAAQHPRPLPAAVPAEVST